MWEVIATEMTESTFEQPIDVDNAKRIRLVKYIFWVCFDTHYIGLQESLLLAVISILAI